jgi:hypothetical protein
MHRFLTRSVKDHKISSTTGSAGLTVGLVNLSMMTSGSVGAPEEAIHAR